MEPSHRTYRRSDGILGVGFVIAICGTQQASIAWPDRPAERYIVEDMARNGVEEIIPIELVGTYSAPDGSTVLYQKAPESFVDAMLNAPGGEIVIPEDLTADDLIEPADLEGLTIATDGTVTPAPGTDIVPDGEGGAVVVATAGDDLEAGQMVSVTDGVALPTPAILPEPPAITEAQAIRNYLNDHGTGTPNKVVIAALKVAGYKIESTQVSAAKKEIAASAQSIGS